MTNEKYIKMEKVDLGAFGPTMFKIEIGFTKDFLEDMLARITRENIPVIYYGEIIPEKTVPYRLAQYFQRCPHCGKHAWQWRYRVSPGVTPSPQNMIHARPLKEGETWQKVVCEQCNGEITSADVTIENIIEKI